jgi:hypothetical protein
MNIKIVVPAEVFSRVSGYFRPVNQWNKGKREEFSLRTCMNISGFQGSESSDSSRILERAIS